MPSLRAASLRVRIPRIWDHSRICCGGPSVFRSQPCIAFWLHPNGWDALRDLACCSILAKSAGGFAQNNETPPRRDVPDALGCSQPLFFVAAHEKAVSHTGYVVANDAMGGLVFGQFRVGFRQPLGMLQEEAKQLPNHPRHADPLFDQWCGTVNRCMQEALQLAVCLLRAGCKRSQAAGVRTYFIRVFDAGGLG